MKNPDGHILKFESETPTPYAVRCWYCNNGELVYMTKECYTRQMWAADYKWICPRCGHRASWDDENYEAACDMA